MEELIEIQNGIALLKEETLNNILTFERTIKKFKEEEDKLKKAIQEEMEHKNIIKIDTDELLINYIASSDRESFDTKSFKADHQDLYDEYIKMTPVKASIRMKVKE